VDGALVVWLRAVSQFRAQFEGSPDVTDISQHVNAYDHTQCARKSRCEGQQFFNSADSVGDLCHVCEGVEEVGKEEDGAEVGAPQIGRKKQRLSEASEAGL
jgi:hypothetical protein